jgi:hypothetical protein
MLSYGGEAAPALISALFIERPALRLKAELEIAELANEVTADDRKRRDLIAMSSRC